MPKIERVVYIPSRRRPENVARVIPRWLAQNYKVYVIVEMEDVAAYQRMLKTNEFPTNKVNYRLLPESNRGIGFSRNWIVQHAHHRYPSFIMADDDVMPKVVNPRDNMPGGSGGWLNYMVRLQQAVEYGLPYHNGSSPGSAALVGCAAVHSYQDFLLQGFLKKELARERTAPYYNIGRPILARNGSFGQCYAIHTQRAWEMGGFDDRLTVAYEDNDFMMRGIARGYPWACHSGVWMDRLGGRFESGGIADLCNMPDKAVRQKAADGNDTEKMMSPEYAHKFLACKVAMSNKWPEYTSDPRGKVFRISWKKFYDGQIPSWPSLSAIHGGF